MFDRGAYFVFTSSRLGSCKARAVDVAQNVTSQQRGSRQDGVPARRSGNRRLYVLFEGGGHCN